MSILFVLCADDNLVHAWMPAMHVAGVEQICEMFLSTLILSLTESKYSRLREEKTKPRLRTLGRDRIERLDNSTSLIVHEALFGDG